MTDPANINERYRQACDELHSEAKPLPPDRPRLGGVVAENDKLRGKLIFWRCVAFILASALAVSFACGEDCLNRDLSTAVGDALVIAKHQGGRARVRYLTLYAVPEAKRLETIAAISCLCHQLSHAGVALQPHKISPSVWRLDLNLYDPHNVGWERAWEEIVARDRRWHYGDLAPADANTQGRVFVGSTIEVRCRDGNFYPAKVVELFDGGYFFEINGQRFSSAKNVVREPKQVAVAHQGTVGDWVDYSAFHLLKEITGSNGAILDGREFAFFASRTEIYYTFRNSPKTLNEWLKGWGEFEQQGFGKVGVRGATLDTSNVTLTVRGIERRRLPVWVTWDQDKKHDVTEDRDPFAIANRTQKFDATEAFALTPNGSLDCFIADGRGNRVNAVPAGVAIDDSYGVRELRPGLSCWSCHSRSFGNEETNGFLPFVDDQSQTNDFVKDPKFAAELSSYYGNQEQLAADMERDREVFARGCKLSSQGMKPSQAFSTLNLICNEVELAPVTPEQACRELCVAVEGTPEDTLARWLNGTTNKTLVQLINNRAVHYQRFRLAMNEALHAIHQRRIFAK